MPKAILEFSLPEESREHELALQGANWAGLVETMLEELRSMAKHGDDKPILPSEFRKKIYEAIEDRGLRLD